MAATSHTNSEYLELSGVYLRLQHLTCAALFNKGTYDIKEIFSQIVDSKLIT